MEIHPVQSFKEMSTGKKVATIAAGVVAAGAIVTTGIALHKGKNVSTDTYTKKFNADGSKTINFKEKDGKQELKFFQKIRAGYSEMWQGLKDKLHIGKKETEPVTDSNGTKPTAENPSQQDLTNPSQQELTNPSQQDLTNPSQQELTDKIGDYTNKD